MIAEAYQNLIDNHLIEEDLQTYNQKRSEYLSSTDLKTFIKESAADLKYQMDNPNNEAKPAWILGNGVHTQVLEGLQEYGNRYIIGCPKNREGKEVGYKSDAYKIAREQANKEGKEIISTEDHATAMNMRKSCLKHPLVKDILSQGVSEMVLRTEFMGIKCQCRFDRLSPVWGIPDLKTTRDLHYFEKDARYKFGYFYQAAYYQTLAYHVAPEFGYLPFCFFVVESKPPYKVGVFEMDSEMLEYHRHEIIDHLNQLRDCRERDVWPTGFDHLRTITY